MLSLVGSIQHDPFSSEHVALPSKPEVKKTVTVIEEAADSEDEDSADADDDSEDENAGTLVQRKRKGKS
jgi:hypothetical protein